MLNEALEQDSIQPEAAPEQEDQVPEDSIPPEELPSGPETALLDIFPSNVLREDSVSGGD